MRSPDVSIVITNYNYGKFLARCVRSCLAQKSVNVEVIVVDDCSTDNSLKTLRTFKNDKLIDTTAKTINKEELKNHFKKLRKSGEDKHQYGAGIGLVNIAMKSSEKLKYNFENKDDELYFNIKVYV